MQTTSFENHTPVMSMQLKTENQYLPRRRDGKKCRAILAAVQEWESSLPGRAQDHVAQLVAEQWEKQNGRGISVNKQNLYRYLKNEGGSEKYTSYVIQLSAAIADAMPIEIARKHGLKHGLTETELVANAIKECSEAHQAKLLGAPLQKLEREIREAAIALFNMLPADAAGPLLASISAVAPQFFNRVLTMTTSTSWLIRGFRWPASEQLNLNSGQMRRWWNVQFQRVSCLSGCSTSPTIWDALSVRQNG